MNRIIIQIVGSIIAILIILIGFLIILLEQNKPQVGVVVSKSLPPHVGFLMIASATMAIVNLVIGIKKYIDYKKKND